MAKPVRKVTQTGRPHDQPDLEILRDNLPIFPGTEAEQIVDAFEAGLNSLSQPASATVEEAAKVLFTEIRRILPLAADKGEQAWLLENLASLFMRTAKQTPSRHIGQELLSNTVRLIMVSPEETWREGFRVALRMKMRDGWSGKLLTQLRFELFLYQPCSWRVIALTETDSQASRWRMGKKRTMSRLLMSGSTLILSILVCSDLGLQDGIILPCGS